MKTAVPMHLTPAWIAGELSKKIHETKSSLGARRTTYIRPKTLSIRHYIALAEKLKQKNESIKHP